MGWRIEWDGSARRDVKRLDSEVKKRIVRFMRERVAEGDPRRLGTALHVGDRLWRYRVGDYRVICRLEDALLVVLVVRVGHRSSIYR